MGGIGRDQVRCGINGCGIGKAEWHLACPYHWAMLPKQMQDALYDAYKYDRGSERHHKLCIEATGIIIKKDREIEEG